MATPDGRTCMGGFMTCRFVSPMCRENRPGFARPVNRTIRVSPAPATQKTTSAMPDKKVKAPRGKEKSISILLIEDNRLFRMGLSALLKKQEGLRLLASSEQPEKIPQLGRWQRPDVILLDLGLRDRGSLQVVRGIRETYPEARLIVMGLIPVESEGFSLVKEG